MERSELENAVNRQSWDWLVDLPTRLNVVFEVLDATGAFALPSAPSVDSAALRRLLATDASLRATISRTLASSSPVPMAIGGFEALCFGIGTWGVLVLACRGADADSIDESRGELESIGAWLTGAIDASLTRPHNAISVEPYRIVSFRRILREATSRGSVRNVIGAFVEALSVWDDVRVRAYVGGAAGGFVQYASPVAALSTSPVGLDETIVPRSGRMVRLSRAEVEAFGLVAEPGDTVILSLLTGTDVPWVLVFSGAIDDREQVRLMIYGDILRESLNEVLAATTNRVVGEVTRHQLRPHELLETAAHSIVGQLSSAVGGRHAALTVTKGTASTPALSVGQMDVLASLDQDRPNRLVVQSSDAGSVLTVGIEREQAVFTAIEREVVQAGVSVVHSWLNTALQRSTDGERRRSFRPVDSVFDQLAAQAVDAGQQASVIVIAVDDPNRRPGLLPAWLGRIRAHLRGGDYAGILSDSEIAVLLCDASSDQAAIVCTRLKQLIEAGDTPDAFGHLAIGVRTAESRFEGSLVGAARAGAAPHR